MTTKNLTTDQKVDLVLEKLTKLDSKVDLLSKNQNDLIKTVSEMAIVVGKTADRLEAHIKQTDHDEKSGSFTHFTSGAFVA